jgi:hypothetical protein
MASKTLLVGALAAITRRFDGRVEGEGSSLFVAGLSRLRGTYGGIVRYPQVERIIVGAKVVFSEFAKA